MSEAIEQAAETLEETIDGVVETLEVIRTNPALIVGAGVLGLVVGAAGGYFFAKKQLKSFYEDLASVEIAEAKEFYKGVNKTDDDGVIMSPRQVLEQRHGAEAVEALRHYQGKDSETVEVPEDGQPEGEPYDDIRDEEQLSKLEKRAFAEKETINVFDDPTFDFQEEKKHRTRHKPYVITHDEYFEADKDFETISLTYYEEDDTLVDERDNPVQDVDKTVGDEQLVRFGHGSKDKNIVYVRNEILEIDYEVIRSNGSYLVEVLGLDEPNSLKHSDLRDRRREFLRGDG